MALLGNAAALLWYDIVPEHVSEHEDWHTREHFPERVAIPGFKRGQRWVSVSGSPRYFVTYEVSDRSVLSDTPYLDRLNNPTDWTSRMMQNFRGMARGFCTIENRQGTVLGTTAVTVRFSAAPGQQGKLLTWLEQELMPGILQRRGFTSAFILKSEGAPAMTSEQRIRGRDASVDWVLLITGYSTEDAKVLVDTELRPDSLEARGAARDSSSNVYQLACLADSRASHDVCENRENSRA